MHDNYASSASGSVLGGYDRAVEAQIPHLAQITERMSYVLKRAQDIASGTQENMDRIVGSMPEPTTGDAKGVPVSSDAISQIRNLMSGIESAVSDIERQASRLNSL